MAGEISKDPRVLPIATDIFPLLRGGLNYGATLEDLATAVANQAEADPGLDLLQAGAASWWDADDAYIVSGAVASIPARYGFPMPLSVSSPKQPTLVKRSIVGDGVDDVLRGTTSDFGGRTVYTLIYAGSATMPHIYKTMMRVGADPYPAALIRTTGNAFGALCKPTIGSAEAAAVLVPAGGTGDIAFDHPTGWAGRHTFALVRDGVNVRLYIDGVLKAYSTLAANTPVVAGILDFSLGGSVADGAYQSDSDWSEAGYFNAALDATQLAQIHAHCARSWGGPTIILEGNSLTHQSVDGYRSWPSVLKGNGFGVRMADVINHGTGAATTAQLIARFHTQTVQFLRPGKTITVIAEGGNDMASFLGNKTAAQAIANYTTLAGLFRPYGPVIVCDVADRNDIDNTRRTDFNSTLASTWSTFADDFAQISLDLPDATNTTDFHADEVHWKTAGNVKAEARIRPLIQAAWDSLAG